MRVVVTIRLFLMTVLFAVCACSCAISSFGSKNQTVNPLQYGLNEAKTGIERYYVLRKTHEEAMRMGVGVSYGGIKKILLEIPNDATPIPLTSYTDFAGVTIQVENKQKNAFLFSMSSDLLPVEVKGSEIDGRCFINNKILKSGSKLLIIIDKSLWVEKRAGYERGVHRKDIMFLKEGYGENRTVQSYCTPISDPDCYYCNVDSSIRKVIKGVTLNRTNTSTKKTYLFRIENQFDVEISDIAINTPDNSGFVADQAIYIENCVKIAIKDVVINGTYSLPKQSGYGISLHNIYDLYVGNLYARSNWGVFGNHSINKAYLKNCDINRFDIHCYGRDVKFENCSFVDLYNQFSGVYGEMRFVDCTFSGFIPVLIEGSFNAFTPFDIFFDKCTFNFDKKHACIVAISSFCKDENTRLELKEKCLPNITMSNCCVNVTDEIKNWYVFHTNNTKGYEGVFSYVSKVLIEGLSAEKKSIGIEVFSSAIKTANNVELEVK